MGGHSVVTPEKSWASVCHPQSRAPLKRRVVNATMANVQGNGPAQEVAGVRVSQVVWKHLRKRAPWRRRTTTPASRTMIARETVSAILARSAMGIALSRHRGTVCSGGEWWEVQRGQEVLRPQDLPDQRMVHRGISLPRVRGDPQTFCTLLIP